MKKILITGASGFWGSHLSRHLTENGFAVYGSYFEHKPKGKKSSGARWLRLDATKPQEVVAAIRKIKPDAICHLAGQSSLGQAWEMEERTFSLNTWSCLNFLEAIRRYAPRCRFVYASSIHAYGKMLFDAKKPLNEKSPAKPEGPYGVSKRVSEILCRDFHERLKLDTVVVRLVNCIGPGLSRHFAFSDWCAQIASAEKGGRKILQVGNLNVSRDFLHISDAVRGFALAVQKGKSGEIYNLSSQKVLKLRVFADFLLRKSHVPVTIARQKERVRRREPMEIHISSKKIRSLGWKPLLNPFEGLEELLSQYRREKNHE